MSSSKAIAIAVTLLACGVARGQPAAQGFLVERLYLAPPGAGWIANDSIEEHGRLGGALSISFDYARNPFRVTDGTTRLAVVSDSFIADIGAAITWDRFRFYLSFDAPIVMRGGSGIVGGFAYTGPTIDLGSNPDTITDVRAGADMRIVGKPGGHFRLGASAQLYIPFAESADYVTDGKFRGMVRALVAGDAPWFTWAANVGVHVRTLDVAPEPGPRGSELLFGAAAGAKIALPRTWSLIIGPEIYGASAFRDFFAANATSLEALLSARAERTGDDRVNVRIKLGGGGGLVQHLGAAEWRFVAGVEMFGQRARR